MRSAALSSSTRRSGVRSLMSTRPWPERRESGCGPSSSDPATPASAHTFLTCNSGGFCRAKRTAGGWRELEVREARIGRTAQRLEERRREVCSRSHASMGRLGKSRAASAAAYEATAVLPDQDRNIAAMAVDRYRPAGSPVLAWAQGSLARGLTTSTDLDLVLVWATAIPTDAQRTAWHYSDGTFHLDRTEIKGRKVEVAHRTRSDLDQFVDAIERGDLRHVGVLEPLPSASAILHGELLGGDLAVWQSLRSRLDPLPPATRSGLLRRAANNRAYQLDAITTSLRRDDWYALEHQLLNVLHDQVLPAVFARVGAYYPGRKWTLRIAADLPDLAPIRKTLADTLDVRADPAVRITGL